MAASARSTTDSLGMLVVPAARRGSCLQASHGWPEFGGLEIPVLAGRLAA